MTREEAIFTIEHRDSIMDYCESKQLGEALEMAIEALEQEPCEDTVKREAVLNYIRDNYRRWFINDDAFMQCVNGIKNIVPVTPKQRAGHWEMPQLDDGMSDPIYYQVRCSECGFDLDPQTWHMELHQYGADKYCPNCGAKMEGESE